MRKDRSGSGRIRREGREEEEEAHPHRRVNLDEGDVSLLIDVFYLGVVRGPTLQLHLDNGDTIRPTSCSSNFDEVIKTPPGI